MISQERQDELHDYLYNETNDEETQEWRDDLTAEETALVSEWDEQIAQGFSTLARQILETGKRNRLRRQQAHQM